MTDHKNKPDSYWKEKLTPDEYEILRNRGTEVPFTGELLFNTKTGMYKCAACEHELFASDSKFDSHCGWPSFDDVVDKSNLEFIEDDSHGMIRTEVRCANCGGHLGHLFNDGPTKTGLRYCINSAALKFKKEEK